MQSHKADNYDNFENSWRVGIFVFEILPRKSIDILYHPQINTKKLCMELNFGNSKFKYFEMEIRCKYFIHVSIYFFLISRKILEYIIL